MIKHWNRQLRTRQSGQERMSVLRSRAVNIVGFMMTGGGPPDRSGLPSSRTVLGSPC